MSIKAQRGFTLMELIVTIAFMGTVIVAVMGLFTLLRQTNRTANNYTIGTQVAQQLIEKYRNTPYASIALGTSDVTSTELAPYPMLTAPRSATVTVTDDGGSGLMKRVEVAVSFKDRGGTRNIQLTTLISYKGLNR